MSSSGMEGVQNGLDLPDLEYAQVGQPTVKAEQWVLIGADAFR